jgi:hypothetical protein
MFNEHTTCIAKLMVGLCEDIFLLTQQSTSHIDEIFVLNPILFLKPWCTCFLNIQHIHAISFQCTQQNAEPIKKKAMIILE